MPRNSSGTYTLPAGNPVSPNTIIETAWANPTMSDLGAGLTDSLDRFGRGGMLAPLKVPDGAFNAPPFTFTTEATLGMYRNAAGVLGFAAGGATPLTLSATGITVTGNATITGALSLSALVTNTNAEGFRIANSAGFYSGYDTANTTRTGLLQFNAGASVKLSAENGAQIILNTATADRVWVGTTGNVGIGVSPTAKLQVQGSAPAASPAWNAVDTLVLTQTTNNIVQLHAGATGGTLGYAFAIAGTRSVGSLAYDTTSNFLAVNVNSAERARIDSSGNFGVGGTPNSYGAGIVAQTINASTQPLLDLNISGTRTATFFATAAQAALGSITAIPLLLYTSGSERARIDTSGNLGIGISVGILARVHVSADNPANGYLGVFSNSHSSAGRTGSYLAIDASGIGTWKTGIPADVNAWTVVDVSAAAERLRLDSVGRLSGTALHNNASLPSGTTAQYIASGTYTPTCTNVIGISANTPTVCQWLRVGNVVTVSGKVTITITSTTNELRISLPIASTLAASNNLSGVGAVDTTSGVAGAAFCLLADTTNNAARMVSSLGASTPPVYFTFTYVVL